MTPKTKLWLVGAVCSVIGVTVGSAATYILTRDKFERDAEVQIEEIREWYHKRFAKNEELVKEIDVETTSMPDSAYNKLAELSCFTDYTKCIPSEHHVASDAISKMKDEIDRLNKEVNQDNELDEHMAEREHPEDDDEESAYLESLAENDAIAAKKTEAIKEGRSAYFIELSEFSNEKLWYEKLTWTYYKLDDILADERDNRVTPADRALYVPENLASYFEAKDVVYFRNDVRQTDVEVCIVDDHYEEPPEAKGPNVTIIS